MAYIDLVIRIPEETYQHYKKVWQKRRGSIPESCIAFGIPLPKGHGDLKDADRITDYLRGMRDAWSYHGNDYESGRYESYENALNDIVHEVPTIIEADRTESEE